MQACTRETGASGLHDQKRASLQEEKRKKANLRAQAQIEV